MSTAWMDTLLGAASRAPSGDNTQPTRFTVDGDSIAFDIDPSRDPSPMNAGQRMARIAVGAALENLLIAASALGFATELDATPAPHLARVRLRGEANPQAEIAPELLERTTNRRPYDARPLPAETLSRLAAKTPKLEDVFTHWITDGDRLKAIAATIGQGDGLMFGEPRMRRAFFENVRFDRPPGEAVDEGLSLNSLELTAADRVALRVMRRVPDPVLKLGRASAVFQGKARQLIVSSSGLVVISAGSRGETTDINVGRALQRAWLALTAAGLAAQPMMSIPVLANALDHGDDRLRSTLGETRVTTIVDTFRRLVPELGDRGPAWLMRFGNAPPPTGRTGRLPLSAVTSYDRALSPV